MWTRIQLKQRAKMCLARYYFAAFCVSFLIAVLGGFGGSGGTTNRIQNQIQSQAGGNQNVQEPIESNLSSGIQLVPGLGDSYGAGNGNAGSAVVNGLVSKVFAGAVVVLVILAVFFGIFIQPLFEVGRNRFYMESRLIGQSAGVGKVLWGFSHGYLKIVGTLFVKNLITEGIAVLFALPGLLVVIFSGQSDGFTLLGSILTIGGGVAGSLISLYLQYCYLMVPYILSENPNMKTMDVLRLSARMMDGQKFNTFLLGLSFLGWRILGTMLCGIGTFLLQPYIDATFAELYAVLRDPYSGELSGFRTGNSKETYYYEKTYRYGNADSDSETYSFGGANSAKYGGQYVEPDSVRDVSGGNDGREHEVKRSEGGPGRGYYLNGVFYPYTDEDRTDDGKRS